MEQRESFERHCLAFKLISIESGGCRVSEKDGKFNGNNEDEKVTKKRSTSEVLVRSEIMLR